MPRTGFYIRLAALTAAGYVWLSWNILHGLARGGTETICLFKRVTHVPCPSCGTTRALMELLHGNILASVSVNPLGVIMSAALLLTPLWIAIDLIRRDESLLRTYRSGEKMIAGNLWLSVPTACCVIANWAWNITKGL